MKKRLLSTLLATLLVGSLTACGSTTTQPEPSKQIDSDVIDSTTLAGSNVTSVEVAETKAPKYVFLFIGDGMSYPQFQSASDYLGSIADSDYLQAEPSVKDRQGAKLDGPQYLNFMQFPVAGSAVTYDSCSFAPDSASTATSIATGYKTYSGMINTDESGTTTYETITEKLHTQKNWKVGVISSVNLNHATPAAFYAHQTSRNNYYEIGVELVESGFEYFAGGDLKKRTGNDKDKQDLYELATEAGYKVITTQAEAESVTAASGKVILIDEHLADSAAMNYELDRIDSEWALADYVQKGIEVLDNETGFFLMCEGGKIDWACHANDAGSSVSDVFALADAVQVAIDFANDHADETLILVTGDHETGGLSIGYAGTDYDTYLSNLTNQKISYAQFDEQYIANYKENGTSFEDAMKDVEVLFGLKLNGDADDKLVLTEYEANRLKDSYELTMNGADASTYTQEQSILYGGYNPFSVTVTHILNNKSGISFTSYSHTGLPVAVFAQGMGEDNFKGFYDNTQIYSKLATMLDVK